jgi:hypothetical protein
MQTVIKDPFIDGLIEDGKAKGEANAILLVLAARKLQVTAAERERIMGCIDLAQLNDWITRAVTADSVDALFA